MRLASGKDPNEQIGKKVKLVENRADWIEMNEWMNEWMDEWMD